MLQPIRKRLKPDERRAAMLDAASEVLLAEGIGALTLRHLAAKLGVVPGLVNHYFPEIEALAAETFAIIAEGEVAALFDAARAEPTPQAQITRLIADLLEPHRRAVSLLWLDAWQASRNRAQLRVAVMAAMDLWQDRLSDLIARGAQAGAFTSPHPAAAATRILALIDGLSIQAVIDEPDGPVHAIARGMVVAGVERELGIVLGLV
jgi:AcrR family transcriptional regulator